MGTTGQSITLANSIIGVGILAMPFCFQQCGVLLATLILLFMGLMSRLCCHFLLKSALLARRRNFEFLAFHVFGSAGKMAVEVGIIGFLMGTCIAYFVVVGDLGPQIIAKMFNINQSDILRTSIMVIVSLVCVLPLGLLRNVDSLSNVSAATIGFYLCLVIKVIAEAASQLPSGEWHSRVELWRPAGLLQCAPIFSMALFCQTQLFEIFESLPTLSLEKMNVVTKNAINICTGVYFTLGVFGYIAFCSQDISGNILMSLSPTLASDVIKLGFVMSLAFSFPLIIFPCRASLYSFLYKKVHSSHHDHIINHSIPETTFRCITVSIIAAALFISLLIPNIELVLGLVGSTIGVLICVVFPAACFINVTFKNTNERVLAKGVLVLGLIIMVLGTYANLEAAGDSTVRVADKYDDKYTQDRIDKIVQEFFDKRDKDDVYLKPENSDSLPLDTHKAIINKDIIKDSEVQPPNPVPPESNSNEKLSDTKIKIAKPEEKKILSLPAIQENIDKVSETHPKNLAKNKLEAKMNGISKTEPEKQKDNKPQSNEDKIDIMKQQKLIETIKQHGEEQKELMKEQKEILDEIIKTKKELEQNKNEADSNEAKKIAVESIKQIANMAIQSIGGASEKPDLVDDKKDRLEKLTNEAVQEIAKKAVETIEAIQEIKENPEQANEVKDNVHNIVPPQANIVNSVQNYQNVNPQGNPQNVQPPINSQNVQPQMNPQNIQPQGNLQNMQPLPQNAQPQVNVPNAQPQIISQNAQPSVNSQNAQPQVNPQNLQPQVNPQNALPRVNSQNAQEPVNSQNAQPHINSQNVQQPVNSQNAQPHINSQNVQQPVNLQNAQPQINSQNVQPQASLQNPQQQANPQNIQPQANSQNIQPQANSQNIQPQGNSQNIQPQASIQNGLPQNNPQNVQPQMNAQHIKRDINPSNNQPQPLPQNIQLPPANVQQPQTYNNPAVNAKVEPRNIPSNVNPSAHLPQNNVPILPQVNNEAKVKENIAQNIPKVQNNPPQPAQSQNDVNKHSHSPDEPQSYKQGEDAQVKIPESKLRPNVPLAVAMNDLLSSKQIQEKEAVAEQLNEDIKVNDPPKVLDAQPNVIRQKREVVDCTQKVALEPKDREICDTLVDRPKVPNSDVLPPVDMNEVALPKELPIDAGILHHIGRSLKSFEKDER